MMDEQLAFTFPRSCPDVDIDGPDYRQGFTDGFVAPRDTPCPGGTLDYFAGWQDGQQGVQVPEARWPDSRS